MKRFLSNAAMGLIVIACALVWEVHRGIELGTMATGRRVLFVAGAAVAAVLGLVGMKERHRRYTRYTDAPNALTDPRERQNP